MAATVNLLSSAQAEGVGGFSVYVGASGSAAADTAQWVYGGSSLKVVMDGSAGFQYVTAQVLAATWQPGTAYTASWYILGSAASAGKTLRYFVDSSAGAISPVQTVTLTASGWQRISVTFTTPNPITASWLGPRIDTGSPAQAATFWLDCLQVNAGALLPWVPGGNGAQPLTYMAYVGSLGQPVPILANSFDVQNAIGQRSQGSVQIWGPLGVIWQYGTQLKVYDETSALAYSGYITKDKAAKSGAQQGAGYLEHNLQLMDNCYKADKRVVFTSYLNVSAGAIVQDLVNRVLYQEGVTYTSTSIASGPTIPEVIWNGKPISTALDWLAKNAGYWWNIDVNGVLWFQPYGGVPAPFVLDGTQVDALGSNIAVEAGNDMYVNTQYCKGGNAEKGTKAAPLVEYFHGNGTTRSFTLSYPVSKVYKVLLNGVDVTAQSLTKGSNGGSFYYAPGDAVIAQDPSQTVLGSGDTLEVHYTGRLPAIGKAQNAALIAAQAAREGAGSSGIVESVYSDTKVHTLPAALQIASALLAHYGADTTILTFDTREKGLMEGQMLTVNLPDFGPATTNKQMLITGVAINDQGSQDSGVSIWFHVTAVGSPYDSAQFQTFWQNLMNQQSDPSDLSDTSDQQFTPIVTSNFSHTPSFSTTGQQVTSPICGVTSGPHTMVCGNWVCS